MFKRASVCAPPVDAIHTRAPLEVLRSSVEEFSAALPLKEKQAALVKTTGKVLKAEKRVRSSFILSESQFSLLAELKTRCLSFGINAKKSARLAAGLQLLKDLPKTSLEASILPCLRSDRKAAKIKKPKK